MLVVDAKPRKTSATKLAAFVTFAVVAVILYAARLTLAETALVLSIALLISLAARQQRRRPFFQYLYFCRFPLAIGLLLVALPFLAAGPAASILGNLLIVTPLELGVICGLALLLAWILVVTGGLIAAYAPARFDVPPLTGERGWQRLRSPVLMLLWLVALAAPLLGTAIRSSDNLWWQEIAAVVLGAMATALLIGIGFVVREWFVEPSTGDLPLPGTPNHSVSTRAKEHPAPKFARPLARSLQRLLGRAPFGAGYVDTATSAPLPGHLFLLVLSTLTIVLYLAGYVALRPDIVERDIVPALGYVLVVLIMIGWLLPGLSFLLDRSRVPVLLLATVFCASLYFISDIDHYYPVTDRISSPPQAWLEPALAAWKNRQLEQRKPVLVAVAANGGGITASYWTACVLQGLAEEIPGFTGAVQVVSSVSGGSVGSMYYANTFAPGRVPDARALAKVVEAAGSSSLSATAWGIAYPDFWRAFSLSQPWSREVDRGWSMEQAWRRHLRPQPGVTLEGWQPGVLEGWRPLVLFNSTISETGERMVLSPVPLPPHVRARTFSGLYAKRDLPVVTAARISATFPWVSPITRVRTDRSDEPSYHLADGGYYDNFGVVTLSEWLETILPAYKRLGGEKVLIVRIENPDGAPAEPRRRSGWVYATGGPITTLLSVRTDLQRYHNDRTIDSLLLRWNGRGMDVFDSVFELSARAPLSWHLSTKEKERIRGAWRVAQPCAQEVRRWFSDEHEPVAPVLEKYLMRRCRRRSVPKDELPITASSAPSPAAPPPSRSRPS